MKIAVVAGEASGDQHAAGAVAELKRLTTPLEIFGIGGDLLRAEGAELLFHARDLAIVGLFNVVRHLGMYRRVFATLVERIERERPDVVLLVDYPEFNLRLAKKCKALGLRVVYFISPQIWAWRRGRVRQIAKWVDHMIVILPFEEEFYRQHGVRVTYVGHPIIDQIEGVSRAPRTEGALRLALLPGSRRREVDDLLPAMLDAVKILRAERAVDVFIVQAPTIDREQLDTLMKNNGTSVPVLPRDRGETVANADLAISSSGTATLEAAALGTPVVVMYRLGTLTYQVAKWLVRLPFFSLVNIVAGREVVPELMQHEVTGPNIAAEVRRLVSPDRYAQALRDMNEVRSKLGGAGASRRAAEAIMATVA